MPTLKVTKLVMFILGFTVGVYLNNYTKHLHTSNSDCTVQKKYWCNRRKSSQQKS